MGFNINLLKSNNINNNISSSQTKRYLNNLNSSKIKKKLLEEISSNKKKDESSIKENGLIIEIPIPNTDNEKFNVENEEFFNGDISFTEKSLNPNIQQKNFLTVETDEIINTSINTFKLNSNNSNIKDKKEKKEDSKKNKLLKFLVI